ncbi:Type I secretion system ATP-binding protein PrsD [uncultured Defluviicoccus sp.]|uniref:Type I secretion system ATP-binding protein PrsD n=1 Tax=metagenome TaxID=256318 RepID=A0A380TC18_9ZZZZ|nr:Type I secretion system ATP-binding protein PrsD [uncultured Defluviicoccus sp.]
MKPGGVAGLWALADRGVVTRLAAGGALLTLAINAVGLVSPLFFTQVYDRVMSTGNIPTLIALVFAALIAIGIGAAFEQWRSVTFTRLGASVYADLEGRVFRASHAAAIEGGQGRRSRPLDDLETVRSTLSGSLPGSLLDLIFAPFLLATLYLMNFWLGNFALFVLVLMACVTSLTQWLIAGGMKSSSEAAQAASSLAESHLRAAEAAAAMGYQDRSLDRWAKSNRDAVRAQIRSAAQASGLTALGRSVRSGASILIIAIAASLALSGQVSAGSIIASSIILSRLLAPVDALLGGWRQLAQARLAADRLEVLLARPEAAEAPISVRPGGRLTVDGLSAATAANMPILRGLTFSIEAGETVAILGPSGSGKSTLLRCLMGVWPKMNGVVRLDGAPLTDMDRRAIGPWLGFLPQTSDLAPGTIAENIARFGEASPEAIQAAAKAAGADAMIASLPKGYETDVGEMGSHLSAGQRRRIALARALFGSPSLVCLDEPEANLDRDGEIALAQALQELKASGASVLIAAHRPSIVAHVDKVMVLKDGRIVQFGPAADVLPAISASNLRRVG